MSKAITDVINATILDTETGELIPDSRILIADGRIDAVLRESDAGFNAPAAGEVLDAAGRIVTPGFIDGHVHLLGFDSNLGRPEHESAAYVTAQANRLMKDMLRRGFTTVRDMGGADHGLARAVEEGLLEGPRIFYGGPALSQTGGHGDFRGAGEPCIHTIFDVVPTIGKVCDGVPAVRAAVRQEVRRGAHHIKLMLGGGIASPTDRIDAQQFSVEEISAAVEEAANADIYVSGHAYTPKAMQRALDLGVRCIEHGTLLDEPTAELFADKGAYLVPTLGVGAMLADEKGADYGIPEDTRRKAQPIRAAGTAMLKIAKKYDLNVVFGTDFIGQMQELQSTEWKVRAEAQSGLDILRSATVTAAKLLRREHELGQVKEGFLADLVILNANPLEDPAALSQPETAIESVIARGSLVGS